MRSRLKRWRRAGYPLQIDLLWRVINAIVTGRAPFSALGDRSPEELRVGLDRAERAIDKILNTLASRLGLDHGSVVPAVYALPAMARYVKREYDEKGAPDGTREIESAQPTGDPLIVILATRNAAVDDAHALVERLTKTHDLPEGVLTASTVDKWQGQKNRITIAIHPQSGADQLDDFNSAFGRLAVSCTRATHGLLLVTRAEPVKSIETVLSRI